MSTLYRITIQDPSGSFAYETNAPAPDRQTRIGHKAISFPSLQRLGPDQAIPESVRRYFVWEAQSVTIYWDGTFRIFHPAWCFIVIEEMEAPEAEANETAKPVESPPAVATRTDETPETFVAGDEAAEDAPRFTLTKIPNIVNGYRNRVLTARPAVCDADFLVVMDVVAQEAKADIYLVQLPNSWLVQADTNRVQEVRRAYLAHAEALLDPEHGPMNSA